MATPCLLLDSTENLESSCRITRRNPATRCQLTAGDNAPKIGSHAGVVETFFEIDYSVFIDETNREGALEPPSSTAQMRSG